MGNPIPKKSLGQHWLYDDAALQAMCDAITLSDTDTVLEVGPGLGTLTEKLAAQAASVVSVEFDEVLAAQLPGRIQADNVTVIQQDILQFNLTTLPQGYKLAANIPYYLTSNLLRTLCESMNPFSKAALLMQKEVAERVCAPAGQMSMLSVSVQYYCEVSLGMIVPAGLFTPPPKVDSQILILSYRDKPLFDGINTKLFFRIVKAGFSQRRKTLHNSLSGGLGISRDQTAVLLETAGISSGERAQALTLDNWHALYLAYQKI